MVVLKGLNGWRAVFGYGRLFIGQSRLHGNQRARREIAQRTAFRSPWRADSRPSGWAARRVLGRPSAVHFALSGLRAENSQRGLAEFPRKQRPAELMGGPVVVVEKCVLVL